MKLEAACLQCYCASNALAAQSALLACERYGRQCQAAGVNGIVYDEVFARIYGRLCLVSRHLGKDQAAEEYFRKAAQYYSRARADPLAAGRPPLGIKELIEKETDHGLRVAWKGTTP